MSKNEQTIRSIKDLIATLRAEQAEYNKTTDNKVAGLEIALDALTGEGQVKRTPNVVPVSRKGMKLDRDAALKTFEFLKERGDKPTTVKVVAKKFGITDEAASQRILKLFKDGRAARVAMGQYIVSPKVLHTVGTSGQ